MIYGDLHLHSVYSNSYLRNLPPWVASTPAEILAKAKERGLKVVAITDHDTLKGSQEAQKLAKKLALIVVPACEITSKDGHILAYGIEKEISKKLSAWETIEKIHEQGGLAVAAHPFRARPPIFNGIGLGKLIYKLPLDGVETCHAGMSKQVNQQAVEAVEEKKLNLAKLGSSDAHTLDFIGFGVTVFNDQVKTVDDVLEAIRKRQTEARVVKYEPFWQKYLFSFRDQFNFFQRNFILPLFPSR